jgi:phosphotransferase system HPr (HPr) family protein
MIKKDARVKSQYGIHARPSAAIAIAATREFSKTKISIYDPCTKQTGDARSIIDLMMMAMPCGTKVIVSASGEDEEQAANTIVSIIESFEVDIK